MGRRRVQLSLPFRGRRFAVRAGAWLALFAILVQVLMPLAPAQAGMTADGLFPAVCGLHDFTPDSQPAGDQADRQHCPLCQVQSLDRLVLPERLSFRAFPVVMETAAWPHRSASAPALGSAVPPLPSRGPPSVV
ncbi:MAG: DUF2946 family protein [Magnetospirillum sp.]